MLRGGLLCMRFVRAGCGRLRMALSRLRRGGEGRRSARQMEEMNWGKCREARAGRISMVDRVIGKLVV
jgi:hypothetical protein